MANAGIKGQKAGTALRSILSRLSAPPKECAEAMDNLGISMTDAEGNMKSLDEVMNALRSRFANMNETQQTAYAKAIAGQEAMSGLLAIVNSAPADYQKLTKAVQESEGAAASMANTMNDTVEGQLTLLKSQIEGIQIQIYENLVPSLKKGIQTISDSLKEIDWSSVGSKLGDLAKKALEFAVTIIENFDGIVSVMKSIGTVLAATFVVSKVAGFVQGIVGMVKTFQALKAATDVATSSQLLLNAAQAATPVGLVAAAVAGLAAGLIYLASKNKETEYSFQTLTESEQENIDKVYELSKAYEEATAKRNEAVEAINGEFSHYEELASELDTLVDANGNVKKGYEDRANFIVTTLNEAVGTELALVDGVIENYKEEKDTIDQLIE
jgi:chromosome segregation ATPase